MPGVCAKMDAMKKDEEVRILLSAHFEEWQELSRRMHAQLAPALETQETIRKSIQPILEAQESAQKALAPILAQLGQIGQAIQTPLFEIPGLSRLAAQVAELQRSVQRVVTPAFEQLQRTFRELPPRTQEALLQMASYGWYLDPEMPLPDLWDLKEAFGEGDVAKAENALCEHFEGRLSEIEESIVARFPRRAHLIRAAFGAHRRGEYALSIPVLLAQTDGICKEVTDQYLFMKQDKKPRTAIYVERMAADSFRAALLSPLAQTLPISASEQERVEGSSALNRHMVLHGDDLGYGTKMNSLKTISLVNYVAHVVSEDEQRSP